MNRFTWTTVLLLALFNICLLFGQELPEVVPPSPTVANLMQFEEVPINNYTGQPNISIPIFSKRLDKDLSVNLALSYNTQGIQVDNRSGWTGTGWSLFAGGTISRTVRDVPDEAVKGTEGFDEKTGVYHLPDYWDYEDISLAAKAEFNWKAAGSSENKYDTNLDLYQFNFLGLSGRFVVIKEGSVLVPRLISQNIALKITLDYNTTTYKINGFTIIGPYGHRYVFDVVEALSSSSASDSLPQGGGDNSSGSGSIYTINSSWHLSKIYTPNNQELVTFNYAIVPESYSSPRTHIFNRLRQTRSDLVDMLMNSYNIGIMEPQQIVSSHSSSGDTKKMSSIIFRDSTSVEFNTLAGHPEYSSGGSRLREVIIKGADGLENKKFLFSYDDVSAGRLWLTKVSEVGGNEVLDTELSYYRKNDLPVFGSPSDPWGYHSGIGASIAACNLSSFDELSITTGLLSRIKYPTGGTKEFNFEHNSYSYLGNQPMVLEDYNENPNNRSVAPPILVNGHVYTNSISPPSETIATFDLAFGQDIYISSYMDLVFSDTQYLEDHILKISDSNGSFSRNIALGEVCAVVVNVPAGTYTLSLAQHINENSDQYRIKGDYRINYSQPSPVIRQEMIGGGVRIKNVVFKESENTRDEARKIEYTYTDEIDSLRSSGVIDADMDKLERKYPINVRRYLFNNSERNPGSFFPTTLQYDVTEKGANAQLSQGGYVGYRFVRISEIDNGYSTFNYTTAFDYPSPSQTFNLPNAKPAPNIDYKRGLLLKQRIYDNTDRILREIEHTDYDFVENFMFKTRSVYKPKGPEWQQFYDTWTFYITRGTQAEINIPLGESGFPLPIVYPGIGDSPNSHLTTDFNSGWAQLKETVSKDYFYDASGTPSIVRTRQVFGYDTSNYQVDLHDTYIKEEGNDVFYRTKSYYPGSASTGGYPSTDALGSLIGLNRVNDMIATETFRNSERISSTYTEYKEFGPDLILPERVATLKGAGTPVSEGTQGPTVDLDSFDDRIVFHKYDTYANPLEVSKAGGAHIVYLWGYNQQYPIAKIENATFAEVATVLGVSEAVLKTFNETHLSQLNGLRTGLPKAMISTYTYNPLIGVTSMTDPRGYTMSYEYDGFNRLKQLKDADGFILSENTYHYKGQ